MEIIEHGNPNSEHFKKTKIFKCPICGCKFKANKDEYRYLTQCNEINYYCRCPECSNSAYELSQQKKLSSEHHF